MTKKINKGTLAVGKIFRRDLDKDLFESYMSLEGWDEFPMLTFYSDTGQVSPLLEEAVFSVFSTKDSEGLLVAVAVWRKLEGTLIVDMLEVAKSYQRGGIGEMVMESLVSTSECERVELDAKGEHARKFWKHLGLERVDEQRFILEVER